MDIELVLPPDAREKKRLQFLYVTHVKTGPTSRNTNQQTGRLGLPSDLMEGD